MSKDISTISTTISVTKTQTKATIIKYEGYKTSASSTITITGSYMTLQARTAFNKTSQTIGGFSEYKTFTKMISGTTNITATTHTKYYASSSSISQQFTNSIYLTVTNYKSSISSVVNSTKTTSNMPGNLVNTTAFTSSTITTKAETITSYTTTSINNIYRPLEIVTKSSSTSSQITVTTMYSGRSTYYRTTTYYNVNSRTTSATYRTYSGYKGYRYNNDINPSIFYVTNNATSNAYNNSSYSVTQANSANGTTYQFRTTYITSINVLSSSRVQTGISTYLGNSYTQLRSTSSYATSTAAGNLLSTTAFTTKSSGSTSQSYSTEI